MTGIELFDSILQQRALLCLSLSLSVRNQNQLKPDRLTLFSRINSANFSVSLFHIATCKGNSRSIFISKIDSTFSIIVFVLFLKKQEETNSSRVAKMFHRKTSNRKCGMWIDIYDFSWVRKKKTSKLNIMEWFVYTVKQARRILLARCSIKSGRIEIRRRIQDKQ